MSKQLTLSAMISVTAAALLALSAAFGPVADADEGTRVAHAPLADFSVSR